MNRIIPIKNIDIRKAWLQKLGGLAGVSVKNKEWLTLLEEDTRNSLMIEGYVVSRAEMKDIIQNPKYDPVAYKVLGYFDAALFSYEFALQQYRTNEFQITKAMIKQIHSLMFRSDPNFTYIPGEWRKGEIQIMGSNVKTVNPFQIEEKIDLLVKIANSKNIDVIRKAALVHCMFEQIHPFPDGNGRAGRILLNFILVANGLPNISIKGADKDRANYIKALEKADPIVKNLLTGERDFFRHPLTELEDLINKNLAIATDFIICSRFDREKKLLTVKEMSSVMNKSINTFKVGFSQKKYISSVIDSGGVKSHPDLMKMPIADVI